MGRVIKAEDSYLKNFMVDAQPENLLSVLELHFQNMQKEFAAIPSPKADFAYAPEKWTVRQIMGHVLDAHIIFNYRITAITRGETIALPGFDENIYTLFWQNHSASLSEIAQAYTQISNANLMMAQFFSPEDLHRNGIANDILLTPFKIFRALIGHESHHLKILKERYAI